MAIPGVPNLLKNAPKAIGITLLGNLATKLWDYLFPGPTWGVFNVGTSDPSIEVSSVLELDVAAEARVSDYFIQTGSFTSYNKVRMPDIIPISLVKDGGETSRLQLLYWLDDNATKTTLFDILSPEWRHHNMTLVGYRLRRTARSGAAMIVADCLFKQVREKAVVFSSSTIANPEDQPATPTARVNLQAGEPSSAGGDVAWA
jgi:hypothetical protein